ncbi:MAG TPA: hypothetical protein DEP46_11370 [Blastocatellia bacterium]|nr:hypothetical protein [Blastocatellia bacterium]
MRSGYRILWTDHALDELERTIEYLQLNFSDAEISRLAKAIESTIRNVANNPLMYPECYRSEWYPQGCGPTVQFLTLPTEQR